MSFNPREKTAQEHIDSGTFNPAIYLDQNVDLRLNLNAPQVITPPYTAGDLANATAHFLAYGYGESHRPVFPAGHIYEFGHDCFNISVENLAPVVQTSSQTSLEGVEATRVDTNWDPNTTAGRHHAGWASGASGTAGGGFYYYGPKAKWLFTMPNGQVEVKLAYSGSGSEDDEIEAVTYYIPSNETKTLADIFGGAGMALGQAVATGIPDGIHHSTPNDTHPFIHLAQGDLSGREETRAIKRFSYTVDLSFFTQIPNNILTYWVVAGDGWDADFTGDGYGNATCDFEGTGIGWPVKSAAEWASFVGIHNPSAGDIISEQAVVRLNDPSFKVKPGDIINLNLNFQGTSNSSTGPYYQVFPYSLFGLPAGYIRIYVNGIKGEGN